MGHAPLGGSVLRYSMASFRERVSGLLRKRWFQVVGIVGVLITLAWMFRTTILQAAIGYLMMDEDVVAVDAVYVLGGAPLDRGLRAAEVHRHFPNTLFFTTGSSINEELVPYGIHLDESEMTKNAAVRNGLPADQCITLHIGTSTMEEADAILAHARFSHYDTIAVLSSRFHMRRVNFVFTDRFAEAGIVVRRFGARTDRFDEAHWWHSEDGLLTVQNEFVKLFYYWWKY